MDQIKWENLNKIILTMLRENLFQKFYDSSVPNPAYPKEESSMNEDVPENVVYSTTTIGGDHTRRGVSGQIKEYFNCLDEESIQFQFWETACDLFDSHYAFTVAFNNDVWHYPEDDESDESWEENYARKHENIINLEDQIVDLCREVRLELIGASSSEQIDYSHVRNFISNNFKDKDWYEFEGWDEACKELLKNLKIFLIALGPNKFLDQNVENDMQTQWDNNVEHFDWRLNPILRDLYLGFLFRNPILVPNNDKELKKPYVVIDYIIEEGDVMKTAIVIESIKKAINESEPSVYIDANFLIERHFEIFNEKYNLDNYETLEKHMNR